MKTHLLALVFVPLLAAGCGGSSGASEGAPTGASDSVTTAGAADAQTATVGMTDDLKFAPNAVTAKVGTVTLDVSNLGKVPHNLVFDDEALGKTGTVSGGEKEPLKVVFSKAGTYDFVCTFHSGMTGEVTVT